MNKAVVYNHGVLAGYLIQCSGNKYLFEYIEHYSGPAISLTMPITQQTYEFDRFPPFFDGLLPEGNQLEALLKKAKLDRTDLLQQLITVGGDLVGSITVRGANDE